VFYCVASQVDPLSASSWTVFSAYLSLLLAKSTRGQRLQCLSALDSVCGNLVQSGSGSIECVCNQLGFS
jgi:hypothetical protein